MFQHSLLDSTAELWNELRVFCSVQRFGKHISSVVGNFYIFYRELVV